MSINVASRSNSFEHRQPRSQSNPYFPVSVSFPAVSPVTKQQFAKECDINVILARYRRTGELPAINDKYPQYLDVSAMDFQAHMQVIAGAHTMFNELPSEIRARFKNDPAAFLDFCSDSANRAELAKMGLLTPQAAREALDAVVPPKPKDPDPSPAPAPAG